MVVTEEWLRSNMNGGIGITRKQLVALGVQWPPKKGWLKNILGKEISDEQAEAFVAGRNIVTNQFTGTDGIRCDSVSVTLYVRTLPMGEFLKSPFIAYGYMKPLQGSCAVCARKLHSIAKTKGKVGVHYVNVCNDCFEKIKQ